MAVKVSVRLVELVDVAGIVGTNHEMNPPPPRSSIGLRLAELWWEPSTKVLVGVFVALLIFIAALAVGYRPDPMNSRGMGPRWECSVLGKGAVACARDVIPPARSKQKSD
jgi:hypothetical protein